MNVLRPLGSIGIVLALATSVWGQTSYYGDATILVDVSQSCTDTGIDLLPGDRVIVGSWGAAAGSGIISGTWQWYGPDGVGDNCQDPNKPHPGAFNMLLGRIGDSGALFPVGSFRGITANSAGRLYLCVNDGIPQDNSGCFSAVVYVWPAQPVGIVPSDAPNGTTLKTYPNPTSGGVSIALSLDRADTYALEVFDVTGRRVQRLPDVVGPGAKMMAWDGRDAAGQDVASGIYFLRARSGGGNELERRIVLSR